ncbi:MAG TPA: aminotransferase class V-fold PLP-dependent enzyme [Tepidisphaeraceae bacterium]|nr:aminotransferase class V-fold PLP-dependent enzyme [Tepidisphaeraceae bacterium]
MSNAANKRIYMDAAATSFPKPPGVTKAMTAYAAQLGASAGRGAYAEALETGRLITECRGRINRLINGQNPHHVIFTLNCSDGLNIAIKGLIDPEKKNHAICSEIDHNSILRPLNALQQRGWLEQTRIAISPSTGLADPEDFRRAIRPNTRLIAVTHASNVTGSVQAIGRIGAVAREHGIPFIVDAAQSIGHVPIDVQLEKIDLLAAPGHKSLLGPLGTGFLYVRPGIEKILRPLKEGGTGSISESDTQPDFLPDKYEPGSHNAIGIIGLSEGVRWVAEQGVEKLAAHDAELSRAFIEGLNSLDMVQWYGPRTTRNRVGVFSVRIEGYAPHDLSAILESSYGLLTRSGIHCAPLAHRAIGTLDAGGTTRFSFGAFLTVDEVRIAIEALGEIAASRSPASSAK